MPLTVGTAGHIDHGKTSLVRALTGKDTDRLPEERARGISIDLGYAPLRLPDGRTLSLVDVPGHERFVRTMVAGATGVDLFLLVIDAAEGARPQTHEHLAILRLLGVTHGVVAVTKADSVDAETLALALEEATELVPEAAAVLAVSARTGLGLAELMAALGATAPPERPSREGPTRLYVDRVFTLRGIGTVATGTLWSGSIRAGDMLRAEPAGVAARVRSVHVHDTPVECAEAGRRVALALTGADRHHFGRGTALVDPGSYACGFRLDVALEELEPIPHGARVRVHHGTSAVVARVARVPDTQYAQLRLAQPLVSARGDRLVLRSERTLGGGRILDPNPPRRLDPRRLELLDRGDAGEIVAALVHGPMTKEELRARALLPPQELDEALASLLRAGDWYLSPAWLAELSEHVRALLQTRAAQVPLDPGLAREALLPGSPWGLDVLGLLELDQRAGKVYLPGVVASLGDKADAAARVRQQLESSGFDPVSIADARLGGFLEREGCIVRVGPGLAVSPGAYARARRLLLDECEQAGSVRLARFRDLLGTSRRSAQLLLERFDSDGLTRRVGEERVLRRSRDPAAREQPLRP